MRRELTRASWIAGGLIAGIAATLLVTRTKQRPGDSASAAEQHADAVGQWNIAPGETLFPGGGRDWVTESSMESFPASDPPALSSVRS